MLSERKYLKLCKKHNMTKSEKLIFRIGLTEYLECFLTHSPHHNRNVEIFKDYYYDDEVTWDELAVKYGISKSRTTNVTDVIFNQILTAVRLGLKTSTLACYDEDMLCKILERHIEFSKKNKDLIIGIYDRLAKQSNANISIINTMKKNLEQMS